MKTVRLQNNVVVEIIPYYALPVARWYGESFAAQCVEAPDDVAQGWVYDGENFAEPASDLSALRSAKLSELSAACNAAIVAGCDVTLSATTGHISLTDEDQINLTTAVGAIQQGAPSYPYHLDGQLCAIYPAADILAMGEAATAHKLYHTTYCNHLMAWARRATVDELEGITYGAELPADLAANMEAILNAVG